MPRVKPSLVGDLLSLIDGPYQIRIRHVVDVREIAEGRRLPGPNMRYASATMCKPRPQYCLGPGSLAGPWLDRCWRLRRRLSHVAGCSPCVSTRPLAYVRGLQGLAETDVAACNVEPIEATKHGVQVGHLGATIVRTMMSVFSSSTDGVGSPGWAAHHRSIAAVMGSSSSRTMLITRRGRSGLMVCSSLLSRPIRLLMCCAPSP